MKAISIKEPWASMILAGKKTIETRKWATKYRGQILLCASKNPKSKISGMAFAIADLINVRPMTRGDEKKACCEIYEGAFSWELDNVKKIDPFAVKGQLGLFNVDYEGDMGMKQYISEKDLRYLANEYVNDYRDEIVDNLKREIGLNYEVKDIKWKNGEYSIPINFNKLTNIQRKNLDELIKDARDQDIWINLIPIKSDDHNVNIIKNKILKNLNKSLDLNYTKENIDYKNGVYKIKIDPDIVDSKMAVMMSKLVDSSAKQGIKIEFY